MLFIGYTIGSGKYIFSKNFKDCFYVLHGAGPNKKEEDIFVNFFQDFSMDIDEG